MAANRPGCIVGASMPHHKWPVSDRRTTWVGQQPGSGRGLHIQVWSNNKGDMGRMTSQSHRL